MRSQKHAQGKFRPQEFMKYLVVWAVELVVTHQTPGLKAQAYVMCNKPS